MSLVDGRIRKPKLKTQVFNKEDSLTESEKRKLLREKLSKLLGVTITEQNINYYLTRQEKLNERGLIP